MDLSEIIQVVNDMPGLHILPTGLTPLNPADLLVNENVPKLFKLIKEKYDYIIVDSPPVGLVSDALILGKFSDLVLYIVRQRSTLKKQLDLIIDIINSKKLTNIAFIMNDVKLVGKQGY